MLQIFLSIGFLVFTYIYKNSVGRLYLLNEKILFQIMRNTYPCFIHVKSKNIKDYDKNPLSFFVCFWNVGYNTFKRILDKYPRVDNAQYCNRMLSYVFCSYQQNKWNLVSFLYVFTSSNIALTSSLYCCGTLHTILLFSCFLQCKTIECEMIILLMLSSLRKYDQLWCWPQLSS